MALKTISYIVGIFTLISGGVYLYIYDQMTREPLRVLWVDSATTTDLRNILDEFTDATNITVLVEGVPRELYRETIDREMEKAERPFDVVIGDMSWLASDVSHGWYENITPLVRAGNLIKDPGDLLFANTPKGSGDYYAVPVVLDALGVGFSKSVFEDEGNMTAFHEKNGRVLTVPMTLAELLETATFFAGYQEGKYRVVMPAVAENSFANTLFFSTLIAQGGSLYDSMTKRSEGHINTKLAAEVLEQLRTLVQMSAVLPSIPLNSESAFSIDSFDHLQLLRKTSSTSMYTAFPPVSPRGQSYVVQYAASIVSNTKHARAARKFISWWQSQEAQELWREQRGFPKAGEESKTKPDSFITAYESASQRGIQFIDVENRTLIRDMVQNYLSAYLLGKTNFTAQETLDTIAAAWGELLE